MKIEDYFGKKIDLDETYFLFFPEKPREMSRQQREEYDRICKLPERFKRELLAKLSPKDNPNVVEVTGKQLIEITEKSKSIPYFCMNFEKNKRLMLAPAEHIDFYVRHSKVLAGGEK